MRVSTVAVNGWELQPFVVDVRLDVSGCYSTDTLQRITAEVGEDFVVVCFPVTDQDCVLGFHDGGAERSWGRRLGKQLFDGLATGTLAEDGDLVRVASESCNVSLNPLQGETLVQQAAVLLTEGDFWRVREAEDCIVDRSANVYSKIKCQ